MKKKSIILVLIIIAIVVAIIVKNNIKNQQIQYEIAEVKTYQYFKYKDGENYGVLDRCGKKIIQAKYKNIIIPNLEKDIFICYEETEGSTVVLNSNQEQLFTQYNNVRAIKLKNVASLLCYEKNVLVYEKDGKQGLINFDGKEITSNEYDNIENLLGTEGKFIVSKSGKYGIINLKGTKIIDTKYDKIDTDNYYNEETKYNKSGYIVSNTEQEGYRYGYINYEGKIILNIEYNEIVRIPEQEEVYLIASKNGQYGLYKEGKQIIKPEYQSISYTDNGAIILEKNDQCGIANLEGKIEVPLNYTEIEQQGIYLYAKNEKQNDVYDAQGNKLDMNFNKTVYETENENYRITTLLNNDIIYYGIENKQGSSLIDTKYAYIEYMYKDYFLAENEDGKYGVINSNGNTEIEFKYDLIQKIKGKNIIQVLTRETENSDFYSINLEKTASMKSAKIDNKANYIKIYNNTSTSDKSLANNSNEESKSDNKNDSKNNTKFLDKDGNAIEETSETVKKDEESELPEKIGEYKKVQYSLDDAYYTK